jgi:phosphoglycerate dehydrogenase-like enzyme
MSRLMFLPPQDEQKREWAERLAAEIDGVEVLVPESEDEAMEYLPVVDAGYGWLSPEMLKVADQFTWLQSPQAAPPDWYYYQELVDSPITVTNMRGIYNDHIAQHIMMFVLALARGLPYYLDVQRERVWKKDAPKFATVDLKEATALIVGVGGIGHDTAELLKAFGSRVVGVDARWEWETEGIERHNPDKLDDLLPDADFVIVTLPHTPETEGMWDISKFRKMKSTGYFVNIGRGMTTKLADLVQALNDEDLAGCALDVFDEEPLPEDHPLWTMENVLLTPHIAVRDAANVEERRFQVLKQNAERFARGEELQNVVNKALWY